MLDDLTFTQIQRLTESEARAHLEAIRWPNGPVCPRCSRTNVVPVGGKAARPGVYRCRECRNRGEKRDQFTVTVGTIFEDSKIPLGKWLMAFHLMCASKKGVSALQLKRMLGLGSYQTAWHMAHRVPGHEERPSTPAKREKAQPALASGRSRGYTWFLLNEGKTP